VWVWAASPQLINFHLLQGRQVVGVIPGSPSEFSPCSDSCSVAEKSLASRDVLSQCLARSYCDFQPDLWESGLGLWRVLPSCSSWGRINWGWEEFQPGSCNLIQHCNGEQVDGCGGLTSAGSQMLTQPLPHSPSAARRKEGEKAPAWVLPMGRSSS